MQLHTLCHTVYSIAIYKFFKVVISHIVTFVMINIVYLLFKRISNTHNFQVVVGHIVTYVMTSLLAIYIYTKI